MSTTTRSGPSALEIKLKQIIADHPDVSVHPHSPSGPYVRAVMWTARAGLLKGQCFWDPDTSRWVVRAMALYDVLSAPTVVHPATEADIPAAITQVIAAVNDDLS